MNTQDITKIVIELWDEQFPTYPLPESAKSALVAMWYFDVAVQADWRSNFCELAGEFEYETEYVSGYGERPDLGGGERGDVIADCMFLPHGGRTAFREAFGQDMLDRIDAYGLDNWERFYG